MHATLDNLHLWGITVIQDVQHIFQNYTDVMLFLSHIGDPKFAFTVYFPVAYFLHYSVGKRVVWVAVIAEWLNAVAKWLLHGERPYWWIRESGLYSKESVPNLQQFSITCETGPGSPSGHAMITSAVWYILISDFLFYKQVRSVFVKAVCWAFYLLAMCSIAVSRLYIATHFPHQVVAGIFAGVLLGKIFNSFSTSAVRFHHYAIACVGLTACAAIVYILVKSLVCDPLWSVAKAVKWCAYREWVHMETMVFFSLLRDVSSLLGLGIGMWLCPSLGKNPENMMVKSLQIALALAVTVSADGLKPAHDNLLLFYTLGFIKYTVTVCFIVSAIPLVASILFKKCGLHL